MNSEWIFLTAALYKNVREVSSMRTEEDLPFTLDDFESTLMLHGMMFQSHENYNRLLECVRYIQSIYLANHSRYGRTIGHGS